MHVVSCIAVNVFRESVRDRILYAILAFALLLIGASYLLAQLTAGQDMKIIKDLGLAAMSLFGLFIAVFIGVGLVWKEVEKRSIYSLLSKPLRRDQFILGKYCGLVLTLAVNLSVMTAAFYAVLGVLWWLSPEDARRGWETPALDPALLKAVGLILIELMLVTAIALFFSTFSTPALSIAFTLGLYAAGHFNDDLKHFETVVDSRPAAWLARALYYLLPNLAPFDVKAAVVHGQPVPFGYLALTSAYGLVYIGAILAAASYIFSRRDFK